MRLTTILSAAGAIGVAGALALGASAPANAAQTDAASPSRYRAILVEIDTPGRWDAITNTTARGYVGASGSGSMADALSAGKSVEFSAPGTAGPIVLSDGNCITMGASFVQSEPCDGRPEQDFTVSSGPGSRSISGVAPNGRVYTLDGLRDWVTRKDPGDGYGQWVLENIKAVEPVSDLTAALESKDALSKSAIVGGKGQPGATITLEGPWGSVETEVDEDGKWSKEISGLKTGDNPVTVTQKVDGAEDQVKLLKVTFDAAKTSADVISVDAGEKTATVGGKGEPGVELEITGPDGVTQKVTIGDNGEWTATVPNLEDGDNAIVVKDTSTAKEIPLVATLLPSPIANPAIAGGAGIAALAALGMTLLVRRRNTVKQ